MKKLIISLFLALITVDIFPMNSINKHGRYPYDGTLLHTAVFFGDLNGVKRLLEKGANPELYDEHGMTALDRATYYKELLEGVIDRHLSYELTFGDGSLPPVFMYRQAANNYDLIIKCLKKVS